MNQDAIRESLARQVAELTARNEKLVAALTLSRIALDDWLNTYASEFCDEGRVKEAWIRISEFGTIGYIAHIQEINRAALAK